MGGVELQQQLQVVRKVLKVIQDIPEKMQPNDPSDLNSYNKAIIRGSLQATTQAGLIFFTVSNTNRRFQ